MIAQVGEEVTEVRGWHGNGTGETWRWAYTGISWDSGPAGCLVEAGAEKPQEGAVGLELAGCPGESGAGLTRRAAGTKTELSLIKSI